MNNETLSVFVCHFFIDVNLIYLSYDEQSQAKTTYDSHFRYYKYF